MVIGEVIKKFRTFRNITQEEMAEALHVTPQAISRWETGISYPDITMIPQIVKFLNISADTLFGCAYTFPGCAYTEEAEIEIADPQTVLSQSQIDSIFDYIPGGQVTGKRILTVDDSDFMQKMLREMLSSKGHTVIQAANGMECLNILQTEQVDICVLDINMPVMNGMEALEIIKEKYPKLKVIMLSALCTKENVEKTLALGVDGFVAKPFQASSLLERMR